jgi:hypothetical protein
MISVSSVPHRAIHHRYGVRVTQRREAAGGDPVWRRKVGGQPQKTSQCGGGLRGIKP